MKNDYDKMLMPHPAPGHYSPWRNPPNNKGGRRESASAVDDFFAGGPERAPLAPIQAGRMQNRTHCSVDINVKVNLSLYKQHHADVNYPKPSRSAYFEHHSSIIDCGDGGCRRESVSLVEEFFNNPLKDALTVMDTTEEPDFITLCDPKERAANMEKGDMAPPSQPLPPPECQGEPQRPPPCQPPAQEHWTDVVRYASGISEVDDLTQTSLMRLIEETNYDCQGNEMGPHDTRKSQQAIAGSCAGGMKMESPLRPPCSSSGGPHMAPLAISAHADACHNSYSETSPRALNIKSEPISNGEYPSCQYQQSHRMSSLHPRPTASINLPHTSSLADGVKNEPPSYLEATKTSVGDRMGNKGRMPSASRPTCPQLQARHSRSMPDPSQGMSQVQVLHNPPIPVSVMSSRVQQYPMESSMMPPTPPNSQPGSPNQEASYLRRTPPPPYPGVVTSSGSMGGLQVAVSVPLTPVTGRPRLTHPGCTTIKYNRKNNPELEKRRVHFCDYPGENPIIYCIC